MQILTSLIINEFFFALLRLAYLKFQKKDLSLRLLNQIKKQII